MIQNIHKHIKFNFDNKYALWLSQKNNLSVIQVLYRNSLWLQSHLMLKGDVAEDGGHVKPNEKIGTQVQ